VGHFDFDVLIIGSGFGGSVSALRLAEKGYRVGVLEAGRRFTDATLPRTSWRLKDFLWAPKLGLAGIQRIHVLKDVVVLAGAGVGGGSLVYANTLYVPGKPFFEDPQWSGITDWADELAPYYDQAARMLGVVENPTMTPADEIMKAVADDMGVGHTFRLTPVGVYFGDGPGVTRPDPFFGGVGPERTGCIECGECMTGCRHNAKNTLPKNYLALAEAAGARVYPMTTVSGLEERAGGGWTVDTVRTGALGRPRVRTLSAQQVIVAAGTYNTQKLLHRMKDDGRLPRLSPSLGHLSRTNSESILGAVTRTSATDYTEGVAITSSFFPEPDTHVEPCRYGHGSNVMGLLQSVLTAPRPGQKRWAAFAQTLAREPGTALRLLNVHRWSERSIISLVMQTVDNSLVVAGKRSRLGLWHLTTRKHEDQPAPSFLPVAQDVVKRIAAKLDGIPAGSVFENFDAAVTAHFVGGCPIGADSSRGVIDAYHRVYGYDGLHIVDGSAITANLGVNPSLTITAQAERAMALWPNKGEPDRRPQQGAPYRRVEPVAPKNPVVPDAAPGVLRLPIVGVS
jgi:cholesterol oxidase